jgi:NADPH:quinone reductase-like Zn-dependent oxidoreductase
MADTMRAIRYYRYGSPDVLELQDVDLPAVGDDDILVRVRAAAVNPLDSAFLRGKPYFIRGQSGLSRPKAPGLGADVAGQVETVGRNVTGFRPGDEVFGARLGGMFAEYVAFRADEALLTKPANLTFEQAAAVPIAALTALQALRDKARVQPGHKVLVNGAAGGVGTFAVQLAKAFGAEVTGVCGTGNVELVRSIGADHVVDYTRADFTRTERRYDVLLDVAGNRPLTATRRVLVRNGVLVGIGGPKDGNWIRPVMPFVRLVALSPFVSQRLVPLLAGQRRDDLAVLSELLAAGNVTPVVDRTYPLSEVPDAIRYLEQGHARGKVVITV